MCGAGAGLSPQVGQHGFLPMHWDDCDAAEPIVVAYTDAWTDAAGDVGLADDDEVSRVFVVEDILLLQSVPLGAEVELPDAGDEVEDPATLSLGDEDELG